MKQLFLFFIFVTYASITNAGLMCDMYGEDDILCESEKGLDGFNKRFEYEKQCQKGNDFACKKLAELLRQEEIDGEAKQGAKDLYKLRMKCYQFKNRQACNTLDELRR